MAGSFVFTHYENLKRLGREPNERNRIMIVQEIQTDIMRALSKLKPSYLTTLSPLFHMIKEFFGKNGMS